MADVLDTSSALGSGVGGVFALDILIGSNSSIHLNGLCSGTRVVGFVLPVLKRTSAGCNK